ncbi:MAG: hypothetical protein PHV68_10140 [Candidatus Gastranaerophilales bacterium]|nr:hypothetical protein [Candidatus Gastranaerophilales bacterium]
MKLISKQFKIPKKINPTVEYIEKYLTKGGLKPLRWAVVKCTKENLIIDAILVN